VKSGHNSNDNENDNDDDNVDNNTLKVVLVRWKLEVSDEEDWRNCQKL